MVERYSDYFENYLYLVKLYGNGLHFDPWVFNFKYVAEFVKANTGYDYYGTVGSKSAEFCLNELKEKLAGLIGLEFGEHGFVRFSPENITPEQESKRDEFEKFLEDNGAGTKWYYINKVEALYRNYGLLARFMDFGGYVNCKNDGLIYEFLIVDLDKLTVCSDFYIQKDERQ